MSAGVLLYSVLLLLFFLPCYVVPEAAESPMSTLHKSAEKLLLKAPIIPYME